MSAALEAGPQLRSGFEQGPQDEVVLQDEPAHLQLVMPPRTELEETLDFYGKKARFSLMMLILFCTLPSYQAATTSSRGRAGAFFAGNAPRLLGGSGPAPAVDRLRIGFHVPTIPPPHATDNSAGNADLGITATPGTSQPHVRPRARMASPTSENLRLPGT